MKSYADIQKQIETLQREAEKIRRKEVDDVIARIKEAIQVYGLTTADLGLGAGAGRTRRAAAGAPKKKGPKGKGQVKFRDGSNVWGGRGPRPRWLREALAAGKSLEDFAV